MIINVSHLCKERDRIKVFKKFKKFISQERHIGIRLTMISQKIVITKNHEKLQKVSFMFFSEI